jgi:arylsulfatase A-like enzyme
VAKKRVEYVPDLITREALAFVERNKDRPFYLYYSLNVPHANNEAGDEGMEVPTLGEFAGRDWPAPEKGFAAMIRNIDDDVSRLLARLKELGLEEKTLVIFTSDNGPHMEGGHQVPFFDSNGPLRGYKRDLYEGGIRVPMIARWPGRIPAGTTSDLLSGFQDMLATFAELASVTAPETDGISMAPTLLGQPGKQEKHPYLYWEFRRGGKWRQALRQGPWKAVIYPPKEGEARIELYDLSRDIGEENDVAASHPDLVAEMGRILATERTPWEGDE